MLFRSYQHKYYKAHKKELNKKSLEHYKAHKKERSDHEKRCVGELRDTYVRRRIKSKYKIPLEDISKDMIEREREILTISRLLKEKHNGSITKKVV